MIPAIADSRPIPQTQTPLSWVWDRLTQLAQRILRGLQYMSSWPERRRQAVFQAHCGQLSELLTHSIRAPLEQLGPALQIRQVIEYNANNNSPAPTGFISPGLTQVRTYLNRWRGYVHGHQTHTLHELTTFYHDLKAFLETKT